MSFSISSSLSRVWAQLYRLNSPNRPDVRHIFSQSKEQVSKETAYSLSPNTQITPNVKVNDVMNYMVNNAQNGEKTHTQTMARDLSISLGKIPHLFASMKEEGWIRTVQGAGNRLRRYVGSLSFKPFYEVTTLGKRLFSSR